MLPNPKVNTVVFGGTAIFGKSKPEHFSGVAVVLPVRVFSFNVRPLTHLKSLSLPFLAEVVEHLECIFYQTGSVPDQF